MLKKRNVKKIELYGNVLMLIALSGSTLLAFYTLHDVQTAHGASLYLSMVFGQTSRTYFDLGVDLIGMLLFLLAILLPTLCLKAKSLQSFFRLFAVYLALMPVADPGKIVHLPEAFSNIALRESLRTGDWGTFFFSELTPCFELCRILFPFLILLFALTKTLPDTPKVSPLFLFLATGAFLVFCLTVDPADTFFYFTCYFLILMCFRLWEALCAASSRFAFWSNILFYGCLLRGIYRMLVLVSASHM